MKLKSITEHEEDVFRRHKTLLTGIECPSCKEELQYFDHTIMLSSPGQKDVKCFGCGFRDRIFVLQY